MGSFVSPPVWLESHVTGVLPNSKSAGQNLRQWWDYGTIRPIPRYASVPLRAEVNGGRTFSPSENRGLIARSTADDKSPPAMIRGDEMEKHSGAKNRWVLIYMLV